MLSERLLREQLRVPSPCTGCVAATLLLLFKDSGSRASVVILCPIRGSLSRIIFPLLPRACGRWPCVVPRCCRFVVLGSMRVPGAAAALSGTVWTLRSIREPRTILAVHYYYYRYYYYYYYYIVPCRYRITVVRCTRNVTIRRASCQSAPARVTT